MTIKFKRVLSYLRTLLKNLFFWGGLGAVLLMGVVLYLVVDLAVMPAYTRHDEAVTVPDVMYLPYDQAAANLERVGLTAVRKQGGYQRDLAPDAVSEQHPMANTSVKPGRQVYLTINSGVAPQVQVPSVVGLSRRAARSQMLALGFEVEEEVRDPVPAPNPNTITRHEPEAGETHPVGTAVTLYYSAGLSDTYVTVPDVTGLPIEEAEAVLLNQYNLRAIVLGQNGTMVLKQGPEAGIRMREGSEIRLFVEE